MITTFEVVFLGTIWGFDYFIFFFLGDGINKTSSSGIVVPFFSMHDTKWISFIIKVVMDAAIPNMGRFLFVCFYQSFFY